MASRGKAGRGKRHYRRKQPEGGNPEPTEPKSKPSSFMMLLDDDEANAPSSLFDTSQTGRRENVTQADKAEMRRLVQSAEAVLQSPQGEPKSPLDNDSLLSTSAPDKGSFIQSPGAAHAAAEAAKEVSAATDKSLAPNKIKEKEGLTNFIAVMEGRATTEEQSVHPRKKSVGKLHVDQSLPLPRVMEIKHIVLHAAEQVGKGTVAPSEVAQERNRNKAVFEILETEAAYVDSLDLMLELLVVPLRKETEEGDGILSKDDIDTIFSDIEAIRGVNSTLAIELGKKLSHWTSTQLFADVFITMAPFFKSYTRYVDNYPRALARARELESSNTQFRQLLGEFRANPRAKKLDVYAFLIKPIQRIPKYTLLLEAVAKFTPSTHPDLPNITIAITKVKSVADYVNKTAAEGESRAKVCEIQDRFVRVGSQNIVEPARKFIREGVMFKFSLSDQGVQKRAIYIFSDLFLTAVILPGAQKQDKLIPLVSACVVDQPNGPYPHMFFLVSPVKTLFLICETREDKVSWMTDINKAISDLVSNNKTLAYDREQYDLVIDDQGIPNLHARVNNPANAVATQLQQSVVQTTDPRRTFKLKNVIAVTIEGLLGLISFKPINNKNLDFSYVPPNSSTVVAAAEAEGGEADPDMEKFEMVDYRPATLAAEAPPGMADSALGPAAGRKSSYAISSQEVMANLLRNKGQIRTAPEVIECSGQVLWNEDKRHEATYPIESSYLVFPESYRSFLGQYTGSITLANKGDSSILLVSHTRKSVPDKLSYYKLRAGETKKFDFKGFWCIEVRNGDCSTLYVTEFSKEKGTGTNTDLGMVS